MEDQLEAVGYILRRKKIQVCHNQLLEDHHLLQVGYCKVHQIKMISGVKKQEIDILFSIHKNQKLSGNNYLNKV